MRIKTTQSILDIVDIKDKVLILKENKYAKILEIKPINFSLKSDDEKFNILNQYSKFLKICNFDFQIIVKTKQERVNKHINYIKQNSSKENSYLNEYIEHINNLTNSNFVLSKKIYLIFSIKIQEKFKSFSEIYNELNQKYLIIKENLLKCGNLVDDFSNLNDDNFLKIISNIINAKENYYENI